jgi:hypothetical protein
MASSLSDVYIDALIDNVSTSDLPKEIDIVIGGGAFNGLYGLGVIAYLKRLAGKGHCNIKRASGTSIGALLAAACVGDQKALDWTSLSDGFERMQRDMKSGSRLSGYKTLVQEHLSAAFPNRSVPEPGLLLVNYWDRDAGSIVTKDTFADHDELVDVLLRSAFIPFISDNVARYKDRYYDGVTPAMFEDRQRETLYVSLMTPMKGMRALVAGEKNCAHRVLSGVLDASAFFVEGRSDMCSWVNRWRFYDCAAFGATGVITHFLYLFLEIGLTTYMKLPPYVRNNSGVQGLSKMLSFLVNHLLFKLAGG